MSRLLCLPETSEGLEPLVAHGRVFLGEELVEHSSRPLPRVFGWAAKIDMAVREHLRS